MAKTKRLATIAVLAVMAIVLSLALTACELKIAHAVRFYGENGQLVSEIQYLTEGEEFIVPEAPEKFGYKFQGWTLDGEIYDFEAEGATLANKTLNFYAKFEKLTDQFIVKFLFEDGKNVVDDQIVAIGDEVVLPANPTDESGKIFEGWKESGKTALYDFSDKHIRRDMTFIAVFGHKWGEWKVTTPATCSEAGEETRVCAYNAEHKETKTIPALGHKPQSTVTENRVEATCDKNGSYDEVVYCSVCNTELSRTQKTITKLGHDVVHHDAKDATCTAKGWYAYDTCSRCDYTTYVEIPAKGHDWGDPTYVWSSDNATCMAERVCKNDNTHKETETATITATVTQSKSCEADELTTYVATFTNTAFEAQTKANVKTADKLGHDVVHHVAKDATCTEKGWNAYDTCSRCDYTTYAEIPAKGHTWNEWTVTTPATCTAAGEKTRTCKNDATHTETRNLPAKGHTEVTDAAVKATCTTEGKTEGKHCSVCSVVLVAQTTIPALGHKDENKDGKCDVCKQETKCYVNVKEYGNENGWKASSLQTTIEIGDVATATIACVKPNQYGQRSGKFYNGVNWLFEEEEDATLTVTAKDGYKIVAIKFSYACNNGIRGTLRCDEEVFESDTKISVNALKATFTAKADDATKKCSLQISSITVWYAPYTPVHTHAWDEGAETVAATCTATGVKTFTCECGETKTETLPALGHVDANNDGVCDRCNEAMPVVPTPEYETKTLAEFVALTDDDTKFYKIEGVVVKVENPTYGNLYITDGTTTLLVYGLCAEKMAYTDGKFVNAKDFNTLGVEVGTHIVIVSAKTTFGTTIEAVGSGLLEKSNATDKEMIYVAKYNVKIADSVSANFELPTYEGVNIAWSSDNAAIAISGTTATVTQSATEQTVTLTAVYTCNTATEPVPYVVKVAAKIEGVQTITFDFVNTVKDWTEYAKVNILYLPSLRLKWR